MKALLSVYDKTGIIDLARALSAAGYELLSSGGTARELAGAGVEVTQVSDVTGAPEMLGGRVKTLHPSIHGGILARASDLDEIHQRGIDPIDIVVVNLYPFADTIQAGGTDDELVEMIDIGGPTMVRAAAKNHDRVLVVTSPTQYRNVVEAIRGGGITPEMRRDFAKRAFELTAGYDSAIAEWMGGSTQLHLTSHATLRYGENPHQSAEILREAGGRSWWADAIQHQGKEMSFNNYNDAEAAWRLAHDIGEGAAVVVKHTNPAGAGRADDMSEAFLRAWAGDPLAAFGGVVALAGTLGAPIAALIAERFIEVVVASEATDEALERLAGKKNLRVLTAPAPHGDDSDFRRIEGGFLVQGRDVIDLEGWSTASDREPTDQESSAMRFMWVVAAHTKSNAVVVGDHFAVSGVGAGDQSRVGAAERAVAKAGARARGAVAASDAFFPFRDGVDVLVDAGVTAIVQPGGSRNDPEVIAAANERGVALVFTGRRHFRH